MTLSNKQHHHPILTKKEVINMDTQKSIVISEKKIDVALQNRVSLARMKQRGAKKKFQRLNYKPEKLERVVSWTP